jgi:hypothetical protein
MKTKTQEPEARKKNIYNLYKEKYKIHPVFEYLYHSTSIKNLNSILSKGLISHNDLEVGDIRYKTNSNKGIVGARDKKTIDGKEVVPPLITDYAINDFFPFYLIPDSPGIKGLSRNNEENYCILSIGIEVIIDPDLYCIFTDGNAAANDTRFEFNIDMIDFPLLVPDIKDANSAIWQQTSLTMDGNFNRIKKRYRSSQEVMRIRNSEFLAFSMQGYISSKYIKHVHFYSSNSFDPGLFDLKNRTYSIGAITPLHLDRSQKFT